MSDLLPANATALERAIVTTGASISALPVPVRHVRNPATCPTALLPFLAWELSVDEWNPDWGEDVKRAVIAASIDIHRHKGTRGAVLRALATIFGDTAFTLVEGASAGLYEAAINHDGSRFYGQAEHWAKYSVYINKPISQVMAADVRSILAAIAPARCHLHALSFEQALNAYNGAIRYDNTFTHGIA